MKKIVLLLMPLLLMTCSETKDVFMIEDSQSLTLCLLSEEVYGVEKQQKTKEYLERREVLQTIQLKGEQRVAFLKEFTNKDNYGVVSRKCKYEPVYALLVDNKPHAFFDVEYCPTLKIVLNGKEPKYMDIVTENSLKELLDEYMK